MYGDDASKSNIYLRTLASIILSDHQSRKRPEMLTVWLCRE